MINKEIKTKAQASKVATEFANDLQEKVDIYDSYKVEKENDGEEYRVVLTSSISCVILTMSCMEYFLEVINAYLVVYKGGITWRVEAFKNADGREYPAIVVCFRKMVK